MPLTRLIAAFGVVTICLVSLLLLLGFLCILYSVYFRFRIRKQGYSQLGYFNRPWIIRIVFILFAILWGIGEIVRLTLLRRVEAVKPEWQEDFCKFYIISNLGLAEPCLFLTILFLLRAALKQGEFVAPSCRKWNWKTAGYIFLFSLPMLIFQFTVVLAGPRINGSSSRWKLPHYFTSSAVPSVTDDNIKLALCTYPLLSTLFLGLYASLLTLYLLWLGRRMVQSVINKGLQRRVLFLILAVSSIFPLRVLLLGLSVLSQPEHILFEALVFSAFFVLLCCTGLGICMLVYCPVADSLALKGLRDLETGRRRPSENHHDAVSLVGTQSLLEASSTTSAGRNSDESTKRGSISFRTMLRDETSTEVYEELSLFSSRTQRVGSAPGSPLLPDHRMFPPNQNSVC